MHSVALEGITESLAAELDPAWNIKVGISFCLTYEMPNHTPLTDHPCRDGFLPHQLCQESHLLGVRPAYSSRKYHALYVNQSGSVHDQGEPDKLAKCLSELANIADPPMRVMLGLEAPALLGPKREKFASWAEGLNLDEEINGIFSVHLGQCWSHQVTVSVHSFHHMIPSSVHVRKQTRSTLAS